MAVPPRSQGQTTGSRPGRAGRPASRSGLGRQRIASQMHRVGWSSAVASASCSLTQASNYSRPLTFSPDRKRARRSASRGTAGLRGRRAGRRPRPPGFLPRGLTGGGAVSSALASRVEMPPKNRQPATKQVTSKAFTADLLRARTWGISDAPVPMRGRWRRRESVVSQA